MCLESTFAAEILKGRILLSVQNQMEKNMKHILRNLIKSTFVVVLVGALAIAAHAQGDSANLYEALKAQNISTQMTATDLTADWHVITAGTNFLSALTSSRDMPYQSYYYTRGEIFPFGNQRYLVVYGTQDKSDFRKNDQAEDDQKGFLLKNAVLELSLLPLNDAQSIHEVKQFDPTTDLLAPDAVAAQDSVSNLKQIGLALFMYTQDYDEKIPPMVAARSADQIHEDVNSYDINSQTTVQTRLQPYTKSVKLFLQPATNRPYLPNYKISRLALQDIKTPASQTFMFYEDAPDSDGKRAVLYLDGHVARIDEDDFQQQRQQQGISASGYPAVMKPVDKP